MVTLIHLAFFQSMKILAEAEDPISLKTLLLQLFQKYYKSE